MNKDLQISVAKVAARSVCRDDVQSTVAHDLHSSTLSISDMSQKNCANFFLSALCQISTNFDNFFTERWQRG